MIEKDEHRLIEAAKTGDHSAFRSLLEPSSGELRVHAYRMLGGFQDAEDALQEARLKAWRSLASYEPHASFRAWMYRIVTNTCLDMLRSRRRRVMPRDVGPPAEPGPPATGMRGDISWLEPFPDALLPASADPESALRQRQSVRLAFVRALQLLPPRQRAALILHDVLDWSASEAAAALDTSVPAIHSALQRARATVARPDTALPPEAAEAEAAARYARAWETGDVDAFVALLAEDAIMSMPPWIYWLDGREAIAASLRSPATWGGEPRPGRYRMVPTAMNGQPAALAYLRGDDGHWTAICLTVIGAGGDGRVSDLSIFVLPEQLAAWGHPQVIDEQAQRRARSPLPDSAMPAR